MLAPVNDLLGLSRPERRVMRRQAESGRAGRPGEADLTSWVRQRYRSAFGPRPFVEEARSTDVQEAFLEAAAAAAKGQVAASIGGYLERVRFAPGGGVVDVPDFVSLAAWVLLEGVRSQQLKLQSCPICRGKWLGSPDGSRYCQRRAPGQLRDCRQLAADKRLGGDAAYRGYRSEYRRVSEAFRRGSIDMSELVRWRDDNGPSAWTPFELWRHRHAGAVPTTNLHGNEERNR